MQENHATRKLLEQPSQPYPHWAETCGSWYTCHRFCQDIDGSRGNSLRNRETEIERDLFFGHLSAAVRAQNIRLQRKGKGASATITWGNFCKESPRYYRRWRRRCSASLAQEQCQKSTPRRSPYPRLSFECLPSENDHCNCQTHRLERRKKFPVLIPSSWHPHTQPAWPPSLQCSWESHRDGWTAPRLVARRWDSEGSGGSGRVCSTERRTPPSLRAAQSTCRPCSPTRSNERSRRSQDIWNIINTYKSINAWKMKEMVLISINWSKFIFPAQSENCYTGYSIYYIYARKTCVQIN